MSHHARIPPSHVFRAPLTILTALMSCLVNGPVDRARGGELTVHLKNARDRVTLVGAIERWDVDGNPRRPVDPRARPDAPVVTAKALALGEDVWRFEKLPAGRYDLVVLLDRQVRLEGFCYPPVLEFDPFLRQANGPPESVARQVTQDIVKSKQYENKVRPLFMEGNDKAVRVLMQLLRDEATSFDAEFGEPVATLRYEVWQYQNRYGGWTKEKRTRVFQRVLLSKRELQDWTWLWDPRLGGIEIQGKPVQLDYELPARFKEGGARGLLRGDAGAANIP